MFYIQNTNEKLLGVMPHQAPDRCANQHLITSVLYCRSQIAIITNGIAAVVYSAQAISANAFANNTWPRISRSAINNQVDNNQLLIHFPGHLQHNSLSNIRSTVIESQLWSNKAYSSPLIKRTASI